MIGCALKFRVLCYVWSTAHGQLAFLTKSAEASHCLATLCLFWEGAGSRVQCHAQLYVIMYVLSSYD